MEEQRTLNKLLFAERCDTLFPFPGYNRTWLQGAPDVAPSTRAAERAMQKAMAMVTADGADLSNLMSSQIELNALSAACTAARRLVREAADVHERETKMIIARCEAALRPRRHRFAPKGGRSDRRLGPRLRCVWQVRGACQAGPGGARRDPRGHEERAGED